MEIALIRQLATTIQEQSGRQIGIITDRWVKRWIEKKKNDLYNKNNFFLGKSNYKDQFSNFMTGLDRYLTISIQKKPEKSKKKFDILQKFWPFDFEFFFLREIVGTNTHFLVLWDARTII